MNAPVLDIPALPPHGGSRVRAAAAAALRAGSRWLDRLAHALASPAVRVAAPSDPVLEFHAEAGAPEGALYVDGRYVGTIVGVNRL